MPVVDGVSGQDNISDLWCNNFKQLNNSSDGALSADLLRTLEIKILSEDIANLSFSSEIIKQAVGKLKRGKSDGGSLVSDHVIEAPPSSLLNYSQLC